MGTDDAEQGRLLWRALCRRDTGAYARLELRVEEVCTRTFRRAGASPERVEALRQDVLVSVWEYASRNGEEPKHLDAFLYWRARGVLTRWLRHDRPREAALEADTAASGSGDLPLLEAVAEELQRAFRVCREQLQETYRGAWEARYEEDRSPEETAEILGIRREQVAVRLHRARRALAECLRKKGVLE